MGKHLIVELHKLKEKLLALSSLVEESVQNAVRSVSELNPSMAKEVIRNDHQIDLKEVDVEEDCLKILALHQPVANDLRFVVASLKINNDLERIGDLAVNIAERSVFLNKLKSIEVPFDFNNMALKTRNMLKNALKSLIHLDAHLASEVYLADSEVDAINREMYARVYEGVRREPNNVEAYIHYLTISRHLERIADYATNIAEDVIYMIDGTIVRHHPEEFSTLKGASSGRELGSKG